MISRLATMVTDREIAVWVLLAFLFVYFIYKEWPEFRKRVSHGAVKEHEDEIQDRTTDQRLDSIEKDVKEIKEKLDRDYQRLNRLEIKTEKNRNAQASISKELELIMEALMGALGGLEELGADGPTKETKGKLQDYLNRKAHRDQQEN